MSTKAIVNYIMVAAITIVVILIILFNVYSLFISRTNHTGLDFYDVVGFLIILLTIAIIFLFLTIVFRSSYSKRYLMLLIIFCSIGILNIVLFEKFNVMMEKSLWGRKGMPNKFEHYLFEGH